MFLKSLLKMERGNFIMKKVLVLFLATVMVLSLFTVSASAEGKTIVYWSMWNSTEPQGIAIQQAINAYTAATGNTVDVQFKGRNGIREGLEPALEAGTVIDLFDEDIDRVNKTWGKYLYNLEELAAATDYEATAIAGLISACREVGNGQLMSIPYQPNIFNYFYNQEIFDEAGVTAPPTTWEEFLDVCQKVKDAGYIPVTSDDAYIDCMLGYHLARYLGYEGVNKLVTEGLWAEEPAVLKTAEAYADLAAKGFFSPTIASSVWPNNQNGELALGESAMYLNGSWLPNEVKEMAGPDFKWGCFAYPTVEGGLTGLEAANYGAQVYGVNKNTAVAAEAFELITYVTKGEFDLILSQESVGIPADTSNTEWPTMLSSVKTVMDSLNVRYPWAAGIQDNVDMTPIIIENFKKLCGGSISAQDFVDALEAASN